jgi:hypothetical protein
MFMINYKILSILFISAALQVSCKQESTIEKRDFTSIFKQLNLDSTSKDTLGIKVDFCQVIGDDWDSIYVIPPYAQPNFVDSIKADNLNDISSELSGAETTEWAVHLVLIKNRKVVSYGLLSAGELDLTHLVDSDRTFFILTEKHCDKFYAAFTKRYPSTWRVQKEKLN